MSLRPRGWTLAKVVFLIVLFSSVSCGSRLSEAPPSTETSRPNVLFILVDTLRADRLQAMRNGVEVMPELSTLAASSRSFAHAVSPCSWTRPAMASLFTGLYPDAHHVMFSADPATPDVPTADSVSPQIELMAEYLDKAGYATGAVQTNANLMEEYGFARGYDVYDDYSGASAVDVTNRAVEVAGELEPPFLLYAHYMDVHLPYTMRPEYRDVFGEPPALSESDRRGLDAPIEYLYDYIELKLGIDSERSFEELSEAAKQELQVRYDAAVRYTDEHVGRLIDTIRREYPNTLVIVLSDHGEHFWEHGLLGHGLTLYEEEIRVPFIISGPGIEPAKVDEPVGTINLLPTIAAYLDLPPSPQWQATTNLLDNLAPTPLFSRTQGPYPSLNVDAHAALTFPDKLIRNGAGSNELYDLHEDPHERSDIYGQDQPGSRELTKLLEEHVRATRAYGENYPAAPKAVLDAASIERLRGIGYGASDEETVEDE